MLPPHKLPSKPQSCGRQAYFAGSCAARCKPPRCTSFFSHRRECALTRAGYVGRHSQVTQPLLNPSRAGGTGAINAPVCCFSSSGALNAFLCSHSSNRLTAVSSRLRGATKIAAAGARFWGVRAHASLATLSAPAPVPTCPHRSG